MYGLKALSFATLLLASQVFASRVNYSMKYTEGGIEGNGGAEKKAGGRIDDSKDDLVLNNMEDWSNNKFTASQHAATKIITVKLVSSVKTSNEASDAVSEAQQLINQNIKDC